MHERLREHMLRRELVSIERDDLDPNSIQAYVLGVGSKLVALAYVYDFIPNGLLLLRIEDITAVEYGATHRLQQDMLRIDGVESAIPFGFSLPLDAWRPAIEALLPSYRMLILECEARDEPDFSIGHVEEVTDEAVTFRAFSGAANWYEPVDIAWSEVTCCQVGTTYIGAYERHFARRAS